MAKNPNAETKKLPEEVSEPKRVGIVRVFRSVVWAIVILAAAGLLWQNPQILKQAKDKISGLLAASAAEEQVPSEIAVLQQEISQLRAELAQRSVDTHNLSNASLEELNQKFENLEKTNLGIIAGKADASTVLGIVSHLDKLEEKVNVLARVTDESALILTAVMMVKDSAERGGAFEYEAAILNQLAQNNLKIKPAVEVIEKIAASGIKSDVFLIGRFDVIYNEITELQRAEFEKTWKDRVNSKLNEFIKVRRTNKQAPEFTGDKTLNEIKKLVDAGDLARALALLRQSDNVNISAKSEALQEWIGWVESKLEFNAAIKQVANNSLAVMKVNSIKKEINND